MSLNWAWRFFKRDTQSLENALLALVLLLAMVMLASVGFLTSRVEQGMMLKANESLAADLRLESGRYVENSPYLQEAKSLNVAFAQTLSLNSIIHYGTKIHLINLIAAQEGYPLRGQILLSHTPYGSVYTVRQLPKIGEVWLDPKLMLEGQLTVGDLVRVGEQNLVVTAVLASRPDQGSGFGDLAPTALVAWETLPSLNLLTPSSRLTQAFLFKGNPSDINVLRQKLERNKSVSEKLVTVGQNSQSLAQSIARIRHFFNLTSVITLSLCLVGLLLATQRFIRRHWNQVALLRLMGMPKQMITKVLLLELMLLGVVVGLVGLGLGFLISQGLGYWMANTFQITLPQPDVKPALLSFLSLGLMLFGFSWPTLKTLSDAPIGRILRRDARLPVPSRLAVVGSGLVAVMLILIALLQDVKLIGGAALGLCMAAAVFYGFALGVLSLFQRFTIRLKSHYRLVAARLNRQRSQVALQIMALSIGLTGLLVLGLVRQDVLSQWSRSLPKDAPNMFMINIAKDSQQSFAQSLGELTGQSPKLMPWVRGRLVGVNGQPPKEQEQKARVKGLAEREQNISISRELPSDNIIIDGRFWTEFSPSPQVSVASEFRDSLGLHVGDQLTFDIAGQTIHATLTSVRKVRWDGFKPNFFLLFSPGAIEDNIGSYMTSVYVSPAKRALLEPMLRSFPSVTVFDVEAILTQLNTFVGHAAMAIQWTFGFTLIAGILVMYAMFQATVEERYYETALLRTMGSSRIDLWKANLFEYVLIGSIAAFISLVVGVALSLWTSIQIFEFDWRFDVVAYGQFFVAAVLFITSMGALGSAWIDRKTPKTVLIQYQDG